MPIALIQSKSGNAGNYSNNNSQSFTSNVSAGNTIILTVVAGSADTISSISGNGNTFILARSYSVADDRQAWLYYAQNSNAGATTVNVTFSSGQFPDSVLIMREYSGLQTSSVLDVTATSSNQSNFIQSHTTSTSPTTTQAEELIIVSGANSGDATPGYSAGSGYGNLISQKGFDLYTYGMMQDKIVTSIGSQVGNYQTSTFVRGIVILASFKAIMSSTPADVTATTQSVQYPRMFL